MRISKVIEEARKQGHKVRVRTRIEADGSKRVRVVSIDGKRFSSGESKGNNELRRIMGQELSQMEKAQRRKANLGGESAEEQGAQREKHRQDRSMPKLTKAERRRLKKMNSRVSRSGHGFKMSARQFRKMKKERGAQEAERQMRRRETASRGDVYSEKVDEYLSEMRYIVDMEKPGAKYARKIIAFFNKHGRVGKDGRYAFFKGHSVSDDAYYAARQKTYKLSGDKPDDATMEAVTKEALDILEAGVKIDGKLVK